MDSTPDGMDSTPDGMDSTPDGMDSASAVRIVSVYAVGKALFSLMHSFLLIRVARGV